MKRLIDYTGNSARELMAEIGGDISVILVATDREAVMADETLTTKEKTAKIINNVFKNTDGELERVLLAIDDTPINAGNLYMRTMLLMSDVATSTSDTANFSASSEQTKTE